MKNTISARNILRKYLLMITCLILFIAGGYRAFTLYRTFNNYEAEIQSIEQAADNNIHVILEAIIKEGYDLTEYRTKLDTTTLHRIITESMTMAEIYDNIVNMNLGDTLITLFDDVFDLTNKSDHIIITIGTKDYVLYSKSNVELDTYKYIETNGEKYITWEEYYQQLESPDIMHDAYEDLSLKRADYVIIRIDGKYQNNTYCSIDDVINDYHQNGMKNMDKYYILTMGVITENGDIFGEADSVYLNNNPNINKIYVFKAVSIGDFIGDYSSLIDSLDQSASTKVINYRNNTEFSNALVNILLITSSIITIMIVIKSLDDENTELNNEGKPK